MGDSDESFYQSAPANDFFQAKKPFALFAEWFGDAEKSEPNDPNAMALASVDDTGLPNVRMVLLKDFDSAGFVFYTNFESAKGRELLSQKKAALVFHWKSLRRQVRVRGFVEQVSNNEADEYFASRARGSQIGAWASKQSRTLESRFALEKAIAKFGLQFGVGAVPRPDCWSGFRLKPVEMEFWHDRPFRLHDRLVFRREKPDTDWDITKVYP